MEYVHVKGSLCAPKGFSAAGIHCGIRKNKARKDLALVFSQTPANAAAVYTSNRVQAASILATKARMAGKEPTLRAIIANSGNANACTGAEGLATANAMADLLAEQLNLSGREVAVMSTGVIGLPLPLQPIKNALPQLIDALDSGAQGAQDALAAIMTTDTREKDLAIQFNIDGHTGSIGAIVKGSGMIQPSMGTMLAIITTDFALSSPALQQALNQAVRRSFNRVSVDGDTSTNDCAIVMANGQAGNVPIELTDAQFPLFQEALSYVCVELAKKMARDGEGATKLLTCTVQGAGSEEGAEKLAKAVIASSLVKTAMFGADANWGRILCALGYAGVDFDASTANISFISRAGEILLCQSGEAIDFDEGLAKKILLEEEVEILIALEQNNCPLGPYTLSAWGCDLSYEYVKINGDYRS